MRGEMTIAQQITCDLRYFWRAILARFIKPAEPPPKPEFKPRHAINPRHFTPGHAKYRTNTGMKFYLPQYSYRGEAVTSKVICKTASAADQFAKDVLAMAVHIYD